MDHTPPTVLVALSGGVDSSTSAALLLERGFVVEVAFIQPWSPPWLPCTWREERRDAMRVAAHLGIPFHTVDLSKEYEADVAQYFVREYREGRTPNPDVMCNKYIKFGALFQWAINAGFDYIATGHYARVGGGQSAVSSDDTRDVGSGNTPPYTLLAGADRNKDQSYFLWTLTQEHLARTLFPVGALQKAHVRELAASFGLPTAAKKDSQGVCFLGKIDMKTFLTHYIDAVGGDVLDTDGRVIGTHDGAAFLTLGQRHGFTVTQVSPESPPLYVVEKDMARNTITVAPEPQVRTRKDAQVILLRDVNWVAGVLPDTSREYSARLRYRQSLFPVTLRDLQRGRGTVLPVVPQPYVPKGQSLVVYDGDICLGGGIIG